MANKLERGGLKAIVVGSLFCGFPSVQLSRTKLACATKERSALLEEMGIPLNSSADQGGQDPDQDPT